MSLLARLHEALHHTGRCFAYTMKSSDPPRRAWRKTSQPTFVINNQNGKCRLRLRYTRGPGHKPKPVLSSQFPSRKEAEQAAFRWRTSWEEGRKGDLADEPQHDSHTEETSASSLVLPQGKCTSAPVVDRLVQIAWWKKLLVEFENAIVQQQSHRGWNLAQHHHKCPSLHVRSRTTAVRMHLSCRWSVLLQCIQLRSGVVYELLTHCAHTESTCRSRSFGFETVIVQQSHTGRNLIQQHEKCPSYVSRKVSLLYKCISAVAMSENQRMLEQKYPFADFLLTFTTTQHDQQVNL